MFEWIVILLLTNKLDTDENMLLVKLNGINNAKSRQSVLSWLSLRDLDKGTFIDTLKKYFYFV